MKHILHFFSPLDFDGVDVKHIPVSVEKFLKQPLFLAGITFSIMTLFFITDLVIKRQWLITLGIMQAIVTLLITVFNVVLVLTAVQISLNYPYVRTLVFKKTSILFLNIPLAILYLYIINSIIF